MQAAKHFEVQHLRERLHISTSARSTLLSVHEKEAHVKEDTMVTMGGDLQPGCLADQVVAGLSQTPKKHRRGHTKKSFVFC
eukprot:452957-Pelagomonas_calceolata.AAC.1